MRARRGRNRTIDGSSSSRPFYHVNARESSTRYRRQMEGLRDKALRGGVARIAAQGANFAVRIVTLIILARLLSPDDFGLVGMVTAFTGVLALFRDFGLSAAAVQKETITEAQSSTLFWINVLVGCGLAIVGLIAAPAIAAWYREPKLFELTAALSLGFVLNSAGIQHGALLQREMRFTALAMINTVSLVAAGLAAIVTALAGARYWSLVAMTLVLPVGTTVGCWIASRWIPGKPQRGSDVRSLLKFGGLLTMNSLFVYLTNNVDKMLIGRYWGVEALGIYGRAYQLVSIPIDNLNSAAGEVAFSGLSRVQNDPNRLKSYFLKGYALVLAVTVPITIACGLLATDLIAVLLGQKWEATVPIFRWLAPTILAFAIVNPLGWFLYSLGMARRALWMSIVIAPVTILAYGLALPFGPVWIARAYSLVMLAWIGPAVWWAVRGTVISPAELFRTALRLPLSLESCPWRSPMSSVQVAASFADSPLTSPGDCSDVRLRWNASFEAAPATVLFGRISRVGPSAQLNWGRNMSARFSTGQLGRGQKQRTKSFERSIRRVFGGHALHARDVSVLWTAISCLIRAHTRAVTTRRSTLI